MSRKANFMKIFDLLRQQVNRVEQYEQKRQALYEKGNNMYSAEYIREQEKELTNKLLSDTPERGERINDALDEIVSDLLSDKLDMGDVALNNALTSINLSKLTDRQQEQIADYFRGNLPALELLDSAAKQKGYENNKFQELFFLPETVFFSMKNKVDLAFAVYNDATSEIYNAHMKFDCVNIAKQLNSLALKLGIELPDGYAQVMENQDMELLTHGFEQGAFGAVGKEIMDASTEKRRY